MILNLIRPKNETEDFSPSVTKNCQTLFEQTHRKDERTMECKLILSKQTFHSKLPIPIEGSWMIGLTGLEVDNSLFNITEENNKYELYKFPDEKAGGVSYEKSEMRLEKISIFQILQLPFYKML